MVSMQQQEEDIRNNMQIRNSWGSMELDQSGVTGTTGVKGPIHVWHDENNLYHSAKFDLNEEFGYRMVNLMKTERIQEKVIKTCWDLYDMSLDRSEENALEFSPYDGATALFDVLGHRWPSDDYSDRTTGQVLDWLAFWSLFRHEVLRHFCENGFNASWVGLMLDHYKTGRHDT